MTCDGFPPDELQILLPDGAVEPGLNVQPLLLHLPLQTRVPALKNKGGLVSSVSDPDPDPLHLAGSGSTLILASDLDPDPDPLKKALIWIRVTPKLFRVKIKTKCFCYLRNAFSKFWR